MSFVIGVAISSVENSSQMNLFPEEMIPDFFQPIDLALLRSDCASSRVLQATWRAQGSWRKYALSFKFWIVSFIWSRVILLWDLKRNAFLSLVLVGLMIVIRPAQEDVVKKFSDSFILSQSGLIFSSHCCSWDLSFFVSAFCFSRSNCIKLNMYSLLKYYGF